MQEFLEKAIEIALRAHRGKKDKGGEAYILHPIRIMMLMESFEERIVALLHDVVEDSEVTLEDLMTVEFPVIIIEAVRLLTRKHRQPYEQYILALKTNKLASKVKLADLEDNLNTKRLKKIGVSDKIRLDKYKKAHKLLLS
jgi:(p)ppGpp synthase/HD superfamily hydrolase